MIAGKCIRRDNLRLRTSKLCFHFVQNRLTRAQKLAHISMNDILDSISGLRKLSLFQLHTFLIRVCVYPPGFIMLTQPCSLWPICQTLLALSICLDLD